MIFCSGIRYWRKKSKAKTAHIPQKTPFIDWFDPEGIQVIAEKKVTYKIMPKKSELSIKFVINYK